MRESKRACRGPRHNLGNRYPGRAKKMAQMLHLAVVTDVVEVVGREVVHRD